MGNYNKRAYGCAVIKSINSNYNADFTHQPRRLPDGKVYATDKALKYAVRNYWVDRGLKVFYYKRLNENLNPLDLNEAYERMFREDELGNDKKTVLKNLLSCLDIRTFGATYANKKKNVGLSIHGTVQFTHGLNRFIEDDIFSEQIMSPFADQKEVKDKSSKTEPTYKEAEASTLGTQFKLREGHYVHHISVNPLNISELVSISTAQSITQDDINVLKDALRFGVTYYDSSAKAGTDNEALFWLELNEDSKLVLPSFVELVSIGEDEQGSFIDFENLSQLLDQENVSKHIATKDLYYDKATTRVINLPAGTRELDLYE
jgi:CRISPR-associated protein Csh2